MCIFLFVIVCCNPRQIRRAIRRLGGEHGGWEIMRFDAEECREKAAEDYKKERERLVRLARIAPDAAEKARAPIDAEEAENMALIDTAVAEEGRAKKLSDCRRRRTGAGMRRTKPRLGRFARISAKASKRRRSSGGRFSTRRLSSTSSTLMPSDPHVACHASLRRAGETERRPRFRQNVRPSSRHVDNLAVT